MSNLFFLLLCASMIIQLQAMEGPILEAAQETDKEFIARAKEKCALVSAKRLVYDQNDYGWWDRADIESFWQDADIKLEYTARSDGPDVIVLRDQNNRAQLNCLLVKINASLTQFASKRNFDYDVKHIALSSDARFLALIKKLRQELIIPESVVRENIVTIHEIESNDPSKEVKRFRIPDSFTLISGIEFNNQTSEIIVFGLDVLTVDYYKFNGFPPHGNYSTEHHLLFELDSTEKIK